MSAERDGLERDRRKRKSSKIVVLGLIEHNLWSVEFIAFWVG
jgi:hypothetical protein